MDIGGIEKPVYQQNVKNPPHLGEWYPVQQVDLLLLQFQVVARREGVVLHFHCSQDGN